MLLEKEIQKLMNELGKSEVAKINISGATITARAFEDASKLFLSTPVYSGGNFIPKSVRQCLTNKAPFDENRIKTSLKVNEENFQIDLNYLDFVDHCNNKQRFIDLLEEFSWLAEKWRDYLDDHDKNDLVRIPMK
jgi:hypothetical protein